MAVRDRTCPCHWTDPRPAFAGCVHDATSIGAYKAVSPDPLPDPPLPPSSSPGRRAVAYLLPRMSAMPEVDWPSQSPAGVDLQPITYRAVAAVCEREARQGQKGASGGRSSSWLVRITT